MVVLMTKTPKPRLRILFFLKLAEAPSAHDAVYVETVGLESETVVKMVTFISHHHGQRNMVI
jgi:hypothetical protein